MRINYATIPILNLTNTSFKKSSSPTERELFKTDVLSVKSSSLPTFNIKETIKQLEIFSFAGSIGTSSLANTTRLSLLNLYIDPKITNNYKVVNAS